MRIEKVGRFRYILHGIYWPPFAGTSPMPLTWDQTFLGLLVCGIGSFMVLYIGPYWFEDLWHLLSIGFGLFASLMLMIKSEVPWQEQFGMKLFIATFIGALVFFPCFICRMITAQ